MKLLWVFLILSLFLPGSCVGINRNFTHNNDSDNNIAGDIRFNNLKYDVYLEMKSEGVYIVNDKYDFNLIIDDNICLERLYGKLLFFRHNTRYTFIIYNYVTKDILETPFYYIRSINFISENKIEITGGISGSKDYQKIILNFPHDGETDKIIDCDNYDERIFVYNTAFDGNYTENWANNVYITGSIELFNKQYVFEFKNYIRNMEIFYSDYYNIYFICAWGISGKS